MASKAALFLGRLEDVLADYTNYDIKSTIGDSVNNNRTPTVSQVIRFLDETGEVSLASELQAVYQTDIIRDNLFTNRARNNNRTDGFDINEFILVFESTVLGGGSNVRTLGQVLRAA